MFGIDYTFVGSAFAVLCGTVLFVIIGGVARYAYDELMFRCEVTGTNHNIHDEDNKDTNLNNIVYTSDEHICASLVELISDKLINGELEYPRKCNIMHNGGKPLLFQGNYKVEHGDYTLCFNDSLILSVKVKSASKSNKEIYEFIMDTYNNYLQGLGISKYGLIYDTDHHEILRATKLGGVQCVHTLWDLYLDFKILFELSNSLDEPNHNAFVSIQGKECDVKHKLIDTLASYAHKNLVICEHNIKPSDLRTLLLGGKFNTKDQINNNERVNAFVIDINSENDHLIKITIDIIDRYLLNDILVVFNLDYNYKESFRYGKYYDRMMKVNSDELLASNANKLVLDKLGINLGVGFFVDNEMSQSELLDLCDRYSSLYIDELNIDGLKDVINEWRNDKPNLEDIILKEDRAIKKKKSMYSKLIK